MEGGFGGPFSFLRGYEMMENFVQPGDVVTVLAPTGGSVSRHRRDGRQAVWRCHNTVAQTLPVEILVEGVVEIAKISALAFAAGDRVYWDNTAKVVNATATDLFVGISLPPLRPILRRTVKVKLTAGGYFTGAA